MNICSDGHEEVCYEVNRCPFCDYVKESEQKIEDLEYEIKTKGEKDEL